MPTKKTVKKQNTKSTPLKSPLAIGNKNHRANGSRLDYIVNARDAMSIKFVRNASELESMDGFFRPVYVHQIFNNEKITGYKDLSIRLFFSQPSLHCYIEIEYTQKLRHDDTTDIVHEFKKWIKAGFTQKKQDFIQTLEDDDGEFEPIGELQCQFIMPSHGQSHDDRLLTEQEENDDDAEDDDDVDDNDRSDDDNKKKSTSSPRNARKARTPRSSRGRRARPPARNRNAGQEIESGNDGDNESDDDAPKSEEASSPRDERLRRRKRRLQDQQNESSPPKKRLKLSQNSNNKPMESDEDDDEDDDDLYCSEVEEDEKQDCIQSNMVDYSDLTNKDNVIKKSKFNDQEQIVYEIRVGSFADPEMREFHLRLQFFVLLYIESSSFLDVSDEIWEVMTISKRCKGSYQTLGYLTLYKFFAFPDKKRLRISQVIIFPPFQRQGLGFEALQHAYNMAKYRDFIEVNVEDPGEGFQQLRDTTDVCNAYMYGCFDKKAFNVCNLTTYHDAIINGQNGTKFKQIRQKLTEQQNGANDAELSYSPHTKRNKKRCDRYNHNAIVKGEPLFPFISQHKKLSKDLYHEAIMNTHKVLKITPEQARIAYECLKWEFIDRSDDDQWKLYKLDVKRRLFMVLNYEPIHNYDEAGIFARLTQEFNGVVDRYQKMLVKRDTLVEILADWHSTHEYPKWIEKKLKAFDSKHALNSNKYRKKK